MFKIPFLLKRYRIVRVRRVRRKTTLEKKAYQEHKESARGLVLHLLEKWNKHYGFSWNKVAIRNQSSRWGSCSSKRNLNFSYKIIFLPERLAEYLVVHELCHLKEFNHSEKFWNIVALAIPDYARRREELRKIDARVLS
jgi:predicted metal-dependent hydrolase